ncbi:hypothetical protein ACNJUT_21900, partial [Mycobacterium tuberculosis]
MTIVDGVASLEVPNDLATIDRATVFAAWGGRFNYGHFLLDSLSALAVVAEQGLLDRFPPLMPKADAAWQRELLGLMLGEAGGAAIGETTAEVVRVQDVLFA